MQQYILYFNNLIAPLENTWIWPGIKEVGKFLGTHLISGMIPAFFIAGAIAIFLDKNRITKLMGAKANPFVAYPIAALSGGILTVCSCGVLPIFTGILQQGAGIGPAFTFLMASPAVNLIALTYTYTLLGTKFMLMRALLVFFSAIAIGLSMKMLCTQPDPEEQPNVIIVEEESSYTDKQLIAFFSMLVLIMVTSTGVFDPILKRLITETSALNLLGLRLIIILAQIIITAIYSNKIFMKAEITLWLRKSKDLFWTIFPKVIGGIFLCGLLATVLKPTNFMNWFDTNNFSGNFLASILGSMMYFGTIVGVSIVATLKDFGMNPGPAMTLLLSAPAVSLPSIIALIPIAGAKRSAVFLTLVIVFSAISGYIFGVTF
jgi:uncharacterized membrane protein YraQ (UPF0718 family)